MEALVPAYSPHTHDSREVDRLRASDRACCIWTALGVALIFASMIQSTARQPEARRDLRPLMWLGFALTEAIVFYALIGALLLVFLV